MLSSLFDKIHEISFSKHSIILYKIANVQSHYFSKKVLFIFDQKI